MKFLIIDRMHESIGPLLEGAGFDYDYLPKITRAELIDSIAGYEGLLVRSKTTVDEEVLAAAKKLRIIGRAGAGLDQLDLEAIERRGITVVNAPEGNRDALAEHAMAMLLALFNRLIIADAEVRRGVWDREGNRGFELMGKTVGIIGFGYMGQAFAERLKGFGVQVIAYDKYAPQPDHPFVQAVSMEELQQKADILSFHVPLTEETAMRYDADFILGFAKNIWVLNTARGGVLDLAALIAALDSGKVIGAALDVLENEKLATLTVAQKKRLDILTASQKVIFSPHVGGWTFESYRKINEVLVGKISKWKNEGS